VFRGEPAQASPFHVFGKLLRFLAARNRSTFAAGKRSFSLTHGRKYFKPPALAFFPQGKGFFDSVLGALQPLAFDRVANKRLLIGSEMYVHSFHRKDSSGERPGENLSLPQGVVEAGNGGVESLLRRRLNAELRWRAKTTP
jgi:hypothetical protein